MVMPRAIRTGGAEVTRLGGETLFAGRSAPVGKPGFPGYNKIVKLENFRWEKELDEKFNGDMDAMSRKLGFDPFFMRWRQEKVTGSFPEMRRRKREKQREHREARLQEIAFEIHRPVSAATREVISRGNHGTTPQNRKFLDTRTDVSKRVREKIKYRDDLCRWKIAERAASCLPEIQRPPPENLRRPQEPKERTPSQAKTLSVTGKLGLNQLMAKLEENFPSLSSAFKNFDKERKGYITAKDFRWMLQEKFNLDLSHGVVNEILAYLDVNDNQLLEFGELRQAFDAAFERKGHAGSAQGGGAGEEQGRRMQAQRPPARLSKAFAVEMVNKKLNLRLAEAVAAYKQLKKQAGGYLNKAEMKSLFFKVNLNILPEHFEQYWSAVRFQRGDLVFSAFLAAVQSGNLAPIFDLPPSNPPRAASLSPDSSLFSQEPDYSIPNRWGLQGTWKHPAGAGYDNRRAFPSFDLATTTGAKASFNPRGETKALLAGTGLRQVDSLAEFARPLVFQRQADALSGTAKLRGASPRAVAGVLGPGFAAQGPLIQRALAHALSREPPSLAPLLPARTKH